jgi:hypothetical protein
LILLDYELNSSVSALQLVKLLRESFPSSPIVLFSLLTEFPSEMKGLVEGVIPKGDTWNCSKFCCRWKRSACISWLPSWLALPRHSHSGWPISKALIL